MIRTLLLLLILFSSIPAMAQNDARQANQAYEQSDFAEAVRLYRQALESEPENPKLHFNLGNSLAQLGRLDEARHAFEQFKSLSDEPGATALADYSIGNLMVKAEDPAAAAEYYRESLRNNPFDRDAKHNYELAMRQQQEYAPQPQARPEEPEESEDEEQQEQDQSPQQEQPEEQPDPGGQQSDGVPDDRPAEMSMEEAQRVLDALQQRERELLENREKPSEEDTNDERDW